ncbi:MAG: dkgB 2 [Bacteroidetes bacterium]|nr:dkgB 2 [Bacteroidota bacterium]
MSSDTLTIGNTTIPKVGLGTYKLTGPDAVKSIEDALQMGYRHIDTAQIYGNEEEVGKAIKNSGISRDEIFITTKVWPADFKGLIPAVEQSLKKLQMDRVDLLLLHWPSDDEANKTGAELLYEAMRNGYAKNVGVSNFNIEQIEKARQIAPIICNQVEYHPYLSQKKMLFYLKEYDMFLTAYRPLAMGQVAKDEMLLDIAAKHKKTAGQIALRWMVQQPNVVVIPKTTHHERLIENLNIFDFEISEEEMAAIFALNKNERLTNPATAPKWD